MSNFTTPEGWLLYRVYLMTKAPIGNEPLEPQGNPNGDYFALFRKADMPVVVSGRGRTVEEAWQKASAAAAYHDSLLTPAPVGI